MDFKRSLQPQRIAAAIRRTWHYMTSLCIFAGGRILIGVIAAGSGFIRITMQAGTPPVEWLSNTGYGYLQLAFGIILIVTTQYRLHWLGRIAAISLAIVYALLVADLLTIPSSTFLTTIKMIERGVFFGESLPFSAVSLWGALCYVLYLIFVEAGAHDEC